MHSLWIAYALWFFGGLGALGLHRHYLGKHPTGVLWFFTGGLGMAGSFYDMVTLPRQVREANLKKGLSEGWSEAQPILEKDSLERCILKAAHQHQGLITPGQVALEGDYPLEVCRKELERLAARNFCEMRITKDGAVIFRFPDFDSTSSKELEI